VGKHPSDLSRGRAFLWTAPSQRVYRLLSYLYYISLTQSLNHSLASPPCASSRAFFCFPTHPLLYSTCITTLHLTPTQTQPGRGGLAEGVHPPSPSTFAPWSSRRQVACFHAPRRLPGQVNTLVFTCDGTNIPKNLI